jgi:RNA polymerase sigma-70 factor (ECF subfamily)
MAEQPNVSPELLAAAQAGDLSAFEMLVRTYTPAVYAHAYRFFGDVTAAEDASQEVWIKVLRSIESFDGRSSFSTWLFRVTRNVCLDLVRRGRRMAVPVDPMHLEGLANDDTAAEASVAVDLEAASRALSPEDRDAFDAVALFGLTYADAGTALGVPAGTVKSRVFRARRSLVTILGLDKNGGA